MPRVKERLTRLEVAIGDAQSKCVCGRRIYCVELDDADVPHCPGCGAIVDISNIAGPLNVYAGLFPIVVKKFKGVSMRDL